MKRIIPFLMIFVLIFSLKAEAAGVVNGTFDADGDGWTSTIKGDGTITYPSNTARIQGHNNGGGSGRNYISQEIDIIGNNFTLKFDLLSYQSSDNNDWDYPIVLLDGVTYRLYRNGTLGTSSSGAINNLREVSSTIHFSKPFTGAGTHTIAFGVHSRDGSFGAGVAIFDNIVVEGGNAPTNILPPKVTGIGAAGYSITTTTGLWLDIDEGDSHSYSYQWQSSIDGVSYTDLTGNGATTNTYNIQYNEGSHYFRCVVTCTDSNPVPHSVEANSNVLYYWNDEPSFDDGEQILGTMSEDSDPTPFTLELHVTDTDATTLSWSIGHQAYFGTASLLPDETTKYATISYVPTHPNYNGDTGPSVDDLFVVRVSDGVSFDDIIVYVQIEPVNDAPVFIGAGGTTSYPDNQVSVIIVDDLRISDVDDLNMSKATIEITNYKGEEDILAFTPAGSLSGTVVDGTLTISGIAPISEYTTAIESITYTNNSLDPDIEERVIAISVTDESITETSGEITSNFIYQTISGFAPTNSDEDGVPDVNDDFPNDPNEWTDTDGDGTGDNADTDDDNDGVLDNDDNCSLATNPDQSDVDKDGVGDVCDGKDDRFPWHLFLPAIINGEQPLFQQ